MITLRAATLADSLWLRALRNDPAVRRQSTTARPVSVRAHARWMAETLSGARACFLVESPWPQRRRIGYARLDWSATNGHRRAVVSIALVADARGHGTGPRLLAALTATAAALHLHQLEANVRTGNIASLICFLKSGYRVIRADRAWVTLVRAVG